MKARRRIIQVSLLFALTLFLPAAMGLSAEETYPGGELKVKYAERDGKKHGTYEEFYESGKTKVRAKYKEGNLDGSYKEYHESGKYKRKASYDEGKLDGTYTEYDEKGKKAKVAEYEDGLLEGEVEYYEDGDLVRTEMFTEGILSHPRSKDDINEALKEIKAMDLSGQPGTPDHHEALRRLMEYRYTVGVPYKELALDEELNMYAHYGAKICAEIGKITHHPKNIGWPEEDYKKAKYGTGKANLSWNNLFALSVDMYMFDSDPSNVGRLGHRRWCINPAMGKVGFGGVVAGGKKGTFGSMTAHDTSNKSGVPDFDYVAYPAAGYMPITMIPKPKFFKMQHAWNITLNPAKYEKPGSDIKVRVFELDAKSKKSKRRSKKSKDDEGKEGTEIAIENFNIDNTPFGMSHCIIFRPKNYMVRDGAKYKVEISGVKPKSGKVSANGGGALPGADGKPLVYFVEFFQ